jgi:signal transduction histidine kinase
MTQKRSRLPGWMPGGPSERGTSDAQAGPASMCAGPLSLVLRPTAPPLALGLVVAASLIAAESLLVYLLEQVAPGTFGPVFLLGVLVISTGWGFGLAVLTSLASALAYVYFHHLQTGGSLIPTEAQDWVAITILLVVALAANTLAGLARARAAEADQRRKEADQRRREAEASRDEVSVLAEQQAALRRVATLVARGATPSEVFSTVATELARCLGVYHHSVLFRYEPDGAGVVLAVGQGDPRAAAAAEALPANVGEGLKKTFLGEWFSLEGDSVAAKVLRSGRTARMDSYENASGSIAARFGGLGIRMAVGAPIIVEGRLWGAAIVGSSRPEPLPADTESRVRDFADLVATAIGNAETRAQLAASRARIVAAGDDARRRFERDLHDGAQQRLVSLGLELRAAEAGVPPDLHPLKEQISHIATTVAAISKEVQEISRGIHPAILSHGGLGPALKALARRSAVPVELDLGVDRRLPDSAEVAAYYVVAEALTNAAKYARASVVTVCVEVEGADLHLSIRDDGIGGADAAKGSGLIGLVDRVEALGGTMAISSQAGNGTSLLVTIPLDTQ